MFERLTCGAQSSYAYGTQRLHCVCWYWQGINITHAVSCVQPDWLSCWICLWLKIRCLLRLSVNQMAPKHKKENAAGARTLKHLRSQLKGLVRRKRRLDKVQISVVPEHVQKMAVMIQMLSGDSRWAIAWVLKWQFRFYLMTFGTSVQPSHAFIISCVVILICYSELLVFLSLI